jgi:hypothetical protein
MTEMMKLFATTVGWCVLLMWLAGAVGLGDFELRFGPSKTSRPAETAPCPTMTTTMSNPPGAALDQTRIEGKS